MSHTRLKADSTTLPRRKLLAHDACVKDCECTTELAQFLRATGAIAPRTHLEDHQRVHEIATCMKYSDPVCEGPSARLKGETSPAVNRRPIQKCNVGSTTFTDISSLAKITKITILSERTTKDLVSNPYIGQLRRLVPEKLRRLIRPARDPRVSIKSEGCSSSDSSAILFPKNFGIHDQWKSHTTSTGSPILHGTFEIPQQYHLREKLVSNSPKYVSPGEMGECYNDISLCSHTSIDYHRGSCKMLSLARRYFMLDNSGRICQYGLTISDEPTAEEVFQIDANSIVVATDAVPGHLWCLRLSNWNIHDARLQELPTMEDETFVGRGRARTTITKDMLIVFKDSETFATWMLTIKELIQQHGKRSRSLYLRRQDGFSSPSSCRSNRRPLVIEERRSSYNDENSRPLDTELSRSHSPLSMDFCFPVSRYGATLEVDREAENIASVTSDKHISIDGSSTNSIIELSTIEARLSTTSYDQSSCNTSPQPFQTDCRVSPETAIRHSLFELPAESLCADFTCDDQNADSADIISHSLFERHPSVAGDDSSTCRHLLPATSIKDLSKSDPKTIFELPPALYRMKVTESLCGHEKDLVLCPNLSWRVDEENSTRRTSTVAASCPPNSPENGGGVRSSAGFSL